MSSFITFEQPLNENIRLCLRLEHLFNQFQYYLRCDSPNNSRLALETLLKIVDASDRPELKSKLIQALNQQACALAQLEQFKEVDREKLHRLLHQIDHLTDALHRSDRLKIGENLRQNVFLKQLRLQMNNPGGVCDFSAPAYALWLQLPEERRRKDLHYWKQELELLDRVVALLLGLTREGSPGQRVVAQDAFYQQALDPNVVCQMVRVTLPVAAQLYPEISVGRHRLAIRLRSIFSHHGEVQPDNVPAEVSFQLNCCRVITKSYEEIMA